jgi:hypothetical protein
MRSQPPQGHHLPGARQRTRDGARPSGALCAGTAPRDARCAVSHRPRQPRGGSLTVEDGFQCGQIVPVRRAVIEQGVQHGRHHEGVVDPIARNLAGELEETSHRFTHLIRDRDARFTLAFDAVFHSMGISVPPTVPQTLRTNAYAERFVRTVRTERHGPARAPDDDPDALLFPVPTDRIQLRPRLVGLINEYQQPT